MIRKLVFGALGALLVGGLVFGKEVFSYLGTGYGRASRAVAETVPVDFQIDRVRNMIRDLEPEIVKSMQAIAREEAELDRLQKEITKRDGELNKCRADVLRLKDDLATGKSEFVYASRKYTAEQVKSDLTARFANFKTRETTAEHLHKIQKARENGLSAARQKLVEMRSAKRQLELDVENLEAKRKMVEVAQTATQFEFDDSQLARARDLVTDLNVRLDVMQKCIQEQTVSGEIPLETTETDNIVDSVAKYFDKSKDAGNTAEVSTSATK